MAVTYDRIAKQYQKITESTPTRHIKQETLFRAVGDLSGRSVLDLACGTGFYTRICKRGGAARVVGVDVSEKMIELAREEERKEPLGIEYLVRDVLDLGRIDKSGGEFDRITAVFLLHYARDREELLTMCRNIHRNLKPGGRFVTLNNNAEQPPETYPLLTKYGFTKSISGPRKDGAPITIILKPGSPEEIHFDVYYWSRATHESVFREAGFREIVWHPMRVSPEGMRKFGREYWRDYLRYPGQVCIE
uniref:Ubiquinone/menaquinone biosynthesis C-methylase UbiE n=1 Tax=Candidatus Kentrum sp. DK TaxID=2126562 RepID=A0A450SB36_9GAMM|nr:MAG: Ubiquinone/menaquinone biosynthesis C-methylase UbiE [Candidatus Kentron sp. DK]